MPTELAHLSVGQILHKPELEHYVVGAGCDVAVDDLVARSGARHIFWCATVDDRYVDAGIGIGIANQTVVRIVRFHVPRTAVPHATNRHTASACPGAPDETTAEEPQ